MVVEELAVAVGDGVAAVGDAVEPDELAVVGVEVGHGVGVALLDEVGVAGGEVGGGHGQAR